MSSIYETFTSLQQNFFDLHEYFQWYNNKIPLIPKVSVWGLKIALKIFFFFTVNYPIKILDLISAISKKKIKIYSTIIELGFQFGCTKHVYCLKYETIHR